MVPLESDFVVGKRNVVAGAPRRFRGDEQTAGARFENRYAQHIADAETDGLRAASVSELTGDPRSVRRQYINAARRQPHQTVGEAARISLPRLDIPTLRPSDRSDGTTRQYACCGARKCKRDLAPLLHSDPQSARFVTYISPTDNRGGKFLQPCCVHDT